MKKYFDSFGPFRGRGRLISVADVYKLLGTCDRRGQ